MIDFEFGYEESLIAAFIDLYMLELFKLIVVNLLLLSCFSHNSRSAVLSLLGLPVIGLMASRGC